MSTTTKHPCAPAERRVAHGAVVGIIGLVVSLAQSLVQVPLLLNFWSSYTYGLWAAVGATCAILTAPDLGHQNYLGNEFNRLMIARGSDVRRVVASGFRCALCIASIELIVAFWACFNQWTWRLFFGNVEPSESPKIIGAVLTYIVFWAVNGSVGGILVRLYPPAGLYARGQWLGIINRFAAFSAIVVAVGSGASLFGAMFAQVAACSVFNIVLFFDLKRHVPEAYPWWHGGDWRTAWCNFRASLVLTFNSIIDQLASNGIILILAKTVNPVGVAVFTTLRTVSNTATQGSTVLLQPVVPDAVRYYVNREPNKLAAVFSISWLVGNSLVCTGFLLGLPVVENLYQHWTRQRLPFDRVLFVALAFAVAVRQWTAPAQTLLNGLNLLRAQTTVVVIRVVVTLGLMLPLLGQLGLTAAGLGLVIGEILGAVGTTLFARRALEKISGKLPRRALWFSIVQLIILSGGFAGFALTQERTLLLAVLATAGVLFIGVAQWIELSQDVKLRLWSTVPLVNRFAGLSTCFSRAVRSSTP